MGIFQKIKNSFKQKSVGQVQYGGFEILKKMTGGGNWDKSKMLRQYEKSLYVFACVQKIAEKVASTEINLYQIVNSKGDTREIQNSPLIDLLYKPNPFQTKAEFLKITMINKKLSGDAFWYKMRNESGKIVELWNLRPDLIEIVKDPEDFIKYYKMNKSDGTQEIFNTEDIVHFKYPTPMDDYFGTSPIKSASVRIDTEEYASNYQRDFFLNNARPDGILSVEDSGMAMNQEDKNEMRREFEKKHMGKGRNSRIAILEGNLKYQQISVTQREMDYIESMKFTRDDILVAFGVPKPIVAVTDDVNRANAETAMHIFLSEVIKPEVKMLFEKINEELVATDYNDSLFIGFEDPTPEDREQKIKEYESGIKSGYLLINEVRAMENYEPIEGGWELYKPLNEVPVGGISKPKAKGYLKQWEERKKKEDDDRKQRLFRGKEILKEKLKLKEKVLAELKKSFKEGDVFDDYKKVKKKKEKKNKEKKPLIKSDLRKEYAKMIIKEIENKSQRLKTEVTKKARKQGEALVAILNREDITKTKGGNQRQKLTTETESKIDDFFGKEEKVFAEMLFPFIEEYARQSGIEAMALVNPNQGFEMGEKIRKSLEKRAEEFGLQVNKTTRDKITKAIDEGIKEGEGMIQISDRIDKVYEEFPTWRADLIARTETTASSNEGFIEAYKQSDVATHKEWIATNDERTRPEHAELDGDIVKVNKTFSNGLKFPSEPNCRCVIGPAFED